MPRFLTHPYAFAIALALGFAAAGCPGGGTGGGGALETLPVVTTDDPRAEADMHAARDAVQAGNQPEAIRRYEAFLREHPSDPLVPIARLELGKIRLANGDVAGARALFREVAAHRDPSVAERGRFYEGVTMHLAGESAAALDVLRPFVGRTVDPEETGLLLTTIGAAAERLGDRVTALDALDALVRGAAPEDDKTAARARIEAIVSHDATAEEIDRAYRTLPHDGYAWQRVARRAIREAFAAAAMDRVREIAEDLRREDLELDDELSAMALRAERTTSADPAIVGAILPLTGRGREVGQRALRGLMLASGSPADGPVAPGTPQVLFRDDGGDPERAARAVDDLVTLHRVIAIVGPMEGPTAARAARRAQELGVPMITLTPASGVLDAGPMIYRLFLTPEGEAAELVRAARARGARRFAVLHPTGPFGETMRTAFAAAVTAQGGEVVATQSYAPDATSFREVTTVAAATPDAVFVADSGRKLALIAPALASAGLWSTPPGATPPNGGRAITLLVPSVGWDETLARSSTRYLQGALVSMPFHAPTATGQARAFADGFQSRFAAPPDAFAAWAFDAYRLVRAAVDAGAQTRGDLATRLTSVRGIDTAGPSGGFATTREPAHGTRLLEVRGTTLVTLAAPPPSSK